MVAEGADLAIAVRHFMPGSKGTMDCACRTIAAGIPARIIDSDAGEPKRLTADDPRLG
jgi:hypothetical protein